MINVVAAAVFGFAFGVLVYDTALDHQRAAAVPVAAPVAKMPAVPRQTAMQYPLDCPNWIAQRGANEPWRVRCAPSADLTRKGL